MTVDILENRTTTKHQRTMNKTEPIKSLANKICNQLLKAVVGFITYVEAKRIATDKDWEERSGSVSCKVVLLLT